MALTYSEQKQISKRYAQAGFDLALSANDVPATLDALSALANALEAHEELARAVHNPLLDPKTLSAAFDALLNAAKAPKSAKQLVGTLVENGRAATLPHVVQAFQALADAHNGVTRGELISATPLDEAAIASIASSLGDKMMLSAYR
jgi:F-type H+-transporting ATPase subunit delta